jgi:hypothetical protein
MALIKAIKKVDRKNNPEKYRHKSVTDNFNMRLDIPQLNLMSKAGAASKHKNVGLHERKAIDG